METKIASALVIEHKIEVVLVLEGVVDVDEEAGDEVRAYGLRNWLRIFLSFNTDITLRFTKMRAFDISFSA